MSEDIPDIKIHDYNPPRLIDYGGDLSKQWYFVYYIWDIEKNQKVRKRVMVYGTTVAARRAQAKRDMKDILEFLKAGATVGKLPDPEIEVKPGEIDLRTFKLTDAIIFAIDKKSTFVRDSTKKDYKTLKNTFFTFLGSKGLSDVLFKDVSTQLIFSFFDYLKEEREVENKTYNNYHTSLHALFNVFVKREVIAKNVTACITRLPVESGGHTPFTDQQVQLIKYEINQAGDRQMMLYISFLYYTLGRPRTEVATLRIKNIKEKTIHFEAGNSKNRKGAHVTIPDPLADLIKQHNLRSYPPDFYIFGKDGVPGPEKVIRDFFYKKHVRILKKLGFTDADYDVYSYKHTAVINLFNAGVDIVDIKDQCRHSNIQQTYLYLKDLGLIRDSGLKGKYPKF